jgi:hypothetical protein
MNDSGRRDAESQSMIERAGPKFQDIMVNIDKLSHIELSNILYSPSSMYIDSCLYESCIAAYDYYFNSPSKLDITYKEIMGKDLVRLPRVVASSYVKDMITKLNFDTFAIRRQLSSRLSNGKVFSTMKNVCGSRIFMIF